MSEKNSERNINQFWIPLQPLLFRQVLILFVIIGILGVRFPLAACTGALFLIWIDRRIWKVVPCIVVCLAVAFGYLLGFFHDPSPQPMPDWLSQSLDSRQAIFIEGKVISTKGQTDNRLLVFLKNVHPVLFGFHETLPSLQGYVALTLEKPQRYPLPGQIIEAELRIRPVRGFHNTKYEDSEFQSYRQGIFYRANRAKGTFLCRGAPDFGQETKEKLRSALVSLFTLKNPPTGSGWTLLPALLFGDRSYMSESDMERLRAAGLAHSIALSGQHLAVVGLAAALIVFFIGRFHVDTFLSIPKQKLVLLYSLPCALIYLWLGSAPYSLIRAGLMLFFWTIFFCRERPTAFPDALIATAGVMIIYDPLCIYDIGVQLSFSAVSGITLITPLLRHLWRTKDTDSIWKTLLRCFWFTLACCFAAQIATWSLVMFTFGYSTWWFFLNLLWLPVLGIWVLPLAFIGLFFLVCRTEFFATLALQMAVFPCDCLLKFLAYLEENYGMSLVWGVRPLWTSLLGFALLFIALAMLQGRSLKQFILIHSGGRLLLSALILLSIGPCLRIWTDRNTQITLRVLDVGQGQAVLLEWHDKNGRKRALIDGGGFFSTHFDTGKDIIAPLLTKNRYPEVDFLFVSHPDRDHIKGLIFFAQHFDVKAVYTARFGTISTSAQVLANKFLQVLESRHIPRETLYAGDIKSLASDITLEVLAPSLSQIPKGNNGLILRLSYQGKGLVLLPGDADASYLRQMVHNTMPNRLQSEILLLPHHGSKSSFLPELYDVVKPKYAVISSGIYNTYNLPNKEVITALKNRNVLLHNTATDGAFTYDWHLTNFVPEVCNASIFQ